MRLSIAHGSAPAARRSQATAWLAPSLLLALSFALLLAGLVYLSQASSVATGGYDLLRLQAERDRWRIRNEQLSYTIVELSSLARVEKDARDHLQLVRPEQLLYLKAH
jgi:hypothetical protein